MPVLSQSRFRFGPFELDTRAEELFKLGFKLKLQGHPIQILAMLLERPGDLVTREEIQQRLWPSESDTFVDFEHGLNNAMRKLRQALGDEAETPKYIETLPRRGYRFIGHVESEGDSGLSAQTSSQPDLMASLSEPGVVSGPVFQPNTKRKVWVALSLLGLVVLSAATYLYYRARHRPLTEKDTIVVGDFANTTGDVVFIDTLRQGLLVELRQSPLLNILSDDKVQATLQQMGRQPQEWLSDQLGRDVCQRSESKAFISGSIASLGSEYVLGLKAVNCQTGEVLFQQQSEVARKENVLYTLGKQGAALRRRLGESLASIQKYNVSLEQATTPSLEALQAYSIGVKQVRAWDYPSAITFLTRAIELDPNFAMAYRGLGIVYDNTDRIDLAKQNYEKAYSLRNSVTERERLRIESTYYEVVTGQIEKAAEILEIYRSIYPRDPFSYTNLSLYYGELGRLDKDLELAREAYGMAPSTLTCGNLLVTYQFHVRLEDYANLLPKCQALQSSSDDFIGGAVALAILRNDEAEMERVLSTVSPGSETEIYALIWKSNNEAYHGRLKKSRELRVRAADMARRRGKNEVTATFLAAVALQEATLGNFGGARRFAGQSLSLTKTTDAIALVALADARAGNVNESQALAEELIKRYPDGTIVNNYWVPTIRASVQMSRQKPLESIEILRTSAPYELARAEQNATAFVTVLEPVYTRGLANLQANRGADAAAAFQKILDYPGIALIYPVRALAHLGLARAYVMQGDTAKAKAEYEIFLALWKDADPDIPIYQQVKAEYAKLQ